MRRRPVTEGNGTERNTAIGMEEKIWYTLDDIDCGAQK